MAVLADWEPENHDFRLYVPEMGDGVFQAEIAKWHVQVGDVIEPETPLVDIVSGEDSLKIQSPVRGRVVARCGHAGETLHTGRELVMFDSELEDEEELYTPSSREQKQLSDAGLPGPLPGGLTGAAASAGGAGVETGKLPVGCSVDVNKAAKPVPGRKSADARFVKRMSVEEVPVTGLSQAMAQRMLNSVQTVPHFTYIEEVDVTELESLRDHLNERREPDRAKINVLALLLAAAARAVVDHPDCNARFDEKTGKVTRHAGLHASIATGSDQGLKMPVLRHVEALDVHGIADGIQRVVAAARNNTAKMEELGGGTLGFTSLGRHGGLAATPIINAPEVAIIGINRVVERPMVHQGKIEVRKMMNLSSSFNQRVIGAHQAAAFVQTIRRLLEHPATIFM